MHHYHVRREKAHAHLRRLAGARSKRPVGAVQAPHQVPEVGPGLGPCAVDGDELGVVEERLDHGVRVVSAPCLIEPQFNLADRIFICLGHHDLSGLVAVHAPARRCLRRARVARIHSITASASAMSLSGTSRLRCSPMRDHYLTPLTATMLNFAYFSPTLSAA